MATLLRNQLTLEIKKGKIYGTRIIEDVQELQPFIDYVNKTDEDLKLMRDGVNNFEENKKVRLKAMKRELIKLHKNHAQIKASLQQHEISMISQKRIWEEKDIPNIESEIDLLRKHRDKAMIELSKSKDVKSE